jgi:hypothetical protein
LLADQFSPARFQSGSRFVSFDVLSGNNFVFRIKDVPDRSQCHVIKTYETATALADANLHLWCRDSRLEAAFTGRQGCLPPREGILRLFGSAGHFFK